MEIKRYDRIVVGSSLPSLLLAYLISKQGQRVAVLEGSDVLGGAWQYIKVFDLDKIDMGPHHIPYSSFVTNFLFEEFGIRLVKLKKALKIFLVNENRYVSPRLHFMKQAIKNLFTFKTTQSVYKSLCSNSSEVIQHSISLFKPFALYNEGGCFEMLEAITDKVRNTNNLTIFTKEQVLGINIKNEAVIVETKTGSFECKKLYCPSSLDINISNIKKEDVALSLDSEKIIYRKKFRNVFFKVNNCTKTIPYILFLSTQDDTKAKTLTGSTCGETFAFLNDITPLCMKHNPDMKRNTSIISLTTTYMDNASASFESTLSHQELFDDLKEKKIISSDAVLIDSQEFYYSKVCRNKVRITQTNMDLNDKVEFFNTLDISTFISEMMGRCDF